MGKYACVLLYFVLFPDLCAVCYTVHMDKRDRLVIDLRNHSKTRKRGALSDGETPKPGRATAAFTEPQPWLEPIGTADLQPEQDPERSLVSSTSPIHKATEPYNETQANGQPVPALQKGQESAARPAFSDFLTWTAAERKEVERHPYWFFLPSAVALLLVLVGIMTHNYFFIAFVVLAFGVAMTYLVRKPRMLTVAITGEGIHAGSRTHAFANLKSFWVDERRSPPELSIETDRHLTPFIAIPISDVQPDAIRRMLQNHLPERKHEELLIDTIARGLGF